MKDYFGRNAIQPKAQNQTSNCETELKELQRKAGFLGRWEAKQDLKSTAKAAIVSAEKQLIEGKLNTIVAAAKVTEAAILAGIVSRAMPAIGALTGSLKTATSAVQQQLTTVTTAELISNQQNAAECISTVLGQIDQGLLSREDGAEVINAIRFLAQYDNEVAMRSTGIAKEAVQSLFECGISRISKSKDQIN